MKGRVLVASMLLLFAADAFANNSFIPNYYRNRREVNEYSAVGWSNRHEAGLHYDMAEGEGKTNSIKDEETEHTSFAPYVFYRAPMNLNIEGKITKGEEKDKPVPAAANTDTDIMDYHLGLGYELEGTPMAFGLTYTSLDREFKNSGTTTDATAKAIGLGFGYKLADDMYAGIGWTHTMNESGRPSVEDKDNAYKIGLGKVYGDRANPMAASEVTLGFENEDHTQTWDLDIKGLYNMDAFQYYGAIGYTTASGDDKAKGWNLTLGADLLFGMFYVGPQIEWVTLDTDANTVADDESMEYSLEAGFRNEMVEAFVRYTMDKDEEEFTPSTSNTETENNTWTIGASYHF